MSTGKHGRRSVCRICYRAKQRDSWNRRKLDPEVKARVIEQRRLYDYYRRTKPGYKLKQQARSLIDAGIKSGLITRRSCEICNTPNAEAHHDDYTQPMMVRWLCRKHHADHHSKRVFTIDK